MDVITKKQVIEDNNKNRAIYYVKAREGMKDVVKELVKEGVVHTILLPGYIGWSPKEGSGIFDAFHNIDGLNVLYYRMDSNLDIVEDDLSEKITDKTIVLLVNYFGFRDRNVNRIVAGIKRKKGLILEDNAHGFFTYQMFPKIQSDFTVFSLHKMFPFDDGGMLLVRNRDFHNLHLHGAKTNTPNRDICSYDIYEIAKKRIENYKLLNQKIAQYEEAGFVETLRDLSYLEKNIPQTYPVRIKKGDRDLIYQIMNEAGYGVISLYHTMIEPLRCREHHEAYMLSKEILNLPVHQDVNAELYVKMTERLCEACIKTSSAFDLGDKG